MKKFFLGPIMVATLLAAQGADAEVDLKAGDAKLKAKAEADIDRNDKVKVETRADGDLRDDLELDEDRLGLKGEATSDPAAVQRSNKASALIGMEVRNLTRDKLGEIKDLVIDLPSGKVQYVVLAVGGFLGVGEKLLAVPGNAFALSDDHTHLVLNADRAKIAGATGFPPTNWPDPKAPRNASYWVTSSASGAPAASETARDARVDLRDDLDRDASASVEVNVDRDKNLTAETRPAKVLTGEVRVVDAEKNLLTIQTSDGITRQVRLNDQSVIRLGREQVVRLNDLKPGYQVKVEYDLVDGWIVARRISRSNAD